MRRLRTTATLLISTASLVAPTIASASPNLWVHPSTASAGAAVTIRGSGWPVIEFCRRRVTLTVDNRRIGSIRVTTNGRFAFAWTVPTTTSTGRHAIRARMLCESGLDGSPRPVKRKAYLRIS